MHNFAIPIFISFSILLKKNEGMGGALIKSNASEEKCQILLDSTPDRWGPGPFRFENTWAKYHSFLSCFEEWRGNGRNKTRKAVN